jgi:hypothetical protein
MVQPLKNLPAFYETRRFNATFAVTGDKEECTYEGRYWIF